MGQKKGKLSQKNKLSSKKLEANLVRIKTSMELNDYMTAFKFIKADRSVDMNEELKGY